MSTLTRDRRYRAFHACAALFLLAVAALCVAAGWWPDALAYMTGAAVNVAGFRMAHRRIVIARAAAEVPDYERIAALERDIFGRAYEHDGAPAQVTSPQPPSALREHSVTCGRNPAFGPIARTFLPAGCTCDRSYGERCLICDQGHHERAEPVARVSIAEVQEAADRLRALQADRVATLEQAIARQEAAITDAFRIPLPQPRERPPS